MVTQNSISFILFSKLSVKADIAHLVIMKSGDTDQVTTGIFLEGDKIMYKRYLLILGIMTAFLFVSVSHTNAQTTVRVKFAKNAYSKSYAGKISGYSYVDYLIKIADEQFLDVELKSANSGLSCVIFGPGGNNVENGTDVRTFSEIVPAGQYKIRVLQPRSAARRGTKANFTIKISSYMGT